MANEHSCCVYLGDGLARNAFGDNHPFGPLRHDAFKNALSSQKLDHSIEFHEDGRFLYPGSGDIIEINEGDAKGTKLNIPMPPGANNSNW